MNWRLPTALLGISIAAVACSSNDGSSGPAQQTGILLDSPVQGVRYLNRGSLALGGITDANGQFVYQPGELTEFSIGGIQLGTSLGQSVVTMLDLAGGSRAGALNLTRFLLTLDQDQNPVGGIQIPAQVSNQAQFLNQAASAFLDGNFEQSQLAEFARGVYEQFGGPRRQLPSNDFAAAHLDCALADAADGSFDDDCGGNPPPSAAPDPSATPAPSGTPAPSPTPGPSGGGGIVPPPSPTPSPTPEPCSLNSPPGSTASANVNQGLVAGYQLEFASFDPGAPYANGAIENFVVDAANRLQLPDGRLLSNPYQRNNQLTEILWLDGLNAHEYALSDNQSGVFNEINVFDLCPTQTGGARQFLGSFTIPPSGSFGGSGGGGM